MHITSRRTSYLLVGIALASLATACPGSGSATGPTPPDNASASPNANTASGLHARYVVLGASTSGATVAWARAIVAPDLPCPTVQSGGAIEMRARDNPHGFSVKVCETAIPLDKPASLTFDGATYSLPTASSTTPDRILVVGDTGCKSSTCAPGTLAEPFASLSAAAAKTPADVILHMGDYNYRGTGSHITVTRDGKTSQQYSYDAGDGTRKVESCLQTPKSPYFSQNAPGSSPRDNWNNWRDDFFAAAGPLLWSAPWVLARGNHELCSRAGPGWFYFLDPSSNLPGGGGQARCKATAAQGAHPFDSVTMTEPYRVDLGALHIVVVDSANACDAFATPAMASFTRAYDDQFAKLSALTPKKQNTWLVTHRPIWGVQSYEPHKSTGCTSANTLSCMNQVMQGSIESALSGALPSEISLSLSGHMHQFQSLTFQGDTRPPQVIVGNSGVSLSLYGPAGAFDATVQGTPTRGLNIGPNVTGDGKSISGHGFLDIRYRTDGTWSGVLGDPAAGTRLAVCGSEPLASGDVCQLSTGVTVP